MTYGISKESSSLNIYFQWFVLSFLWDTHTQHCILLCDLRLCRGLLEGDTILSQWCWMMCTVWEYMYHLCTHLREIMGFVSLNMAKTCANKYINVSQLPRKCGYFKYLCISVLAVLFYETSEIQILVSFLLWCWDTVYCVWQMENLWGGTFFLLSLFLCKHLEFFRDHITGL